MAQSVYHHANILAYQICVDMVVQNNKMFAMMYNIAIADGEDETNLPNSSPPPPPTQPAAHASTHDSVQRGPSYSWLGTANFPDFISSLAKFPSTD